MRIFTLASLAALCLAATAGAQSVNMINNPGFEAGASKDGVPESWKAWTPRENLNIKYSVDKKVFRSGKSSFCMQGNGNDNCIGGVMQEMQNITAGKTYKFTGYFKVEGIKSVRENVVARIVWGEGDGMDYAVNQAAEGQWIRLEQVMTAKGSAAKATLRLEFRWTGTGKVWWDDLSLSETTPVKHRMVKISSVHYRPRAMSEKAVIRQIFEKLDEAAKSKPDIVCLSECIFSPGSDKKTEKIVKQIPGPITDQLGEKAKQHNMYIVVGLEEQEKDTFYNCAVLIDRQGKVAGKYRKIHLPLSEIMAGYTPGDSYPVFNTDFGKIGILICWDNQFQETSRILALNGAEIIFWPSWAGDEVVQRARAADNNVFMVSSVYDGKSMIVDPDGKVLAEAEKPAIMNVTVDLDREPTRVWLGAPGTGDWKNVWKKDRRPELYKKISEPY